MKRSTSTLAIVTLISAFFMAGMPLHRWFHPWGQIMLLLWALSFALALLDVAVLIGDVFDRKRLRRRSD